MIALVLFAGCASDFEDPEIARQWANSASAFAVFLPAGDALEGADGDGFSDASCPTVSDDGTLFEAVGEGCTTADGERYVGRYSVLREGADRTIEWSAWGHASDDDDDAATRGGSATLSSTGTEVWAFEVESDTDGLAPVRLDYGGTIEGAYTGDRASWSGTGEVERRGFTDAKGTVVATTTNQVRDAAVCDNQSASGTSTFVKGKHTMVIEYDGASDCDEEQTVKWSVDGEDLGELDGVGCSSRPGSALALLPILIAGLTRRR